MSYRAHVEHDFVHDLLSVHLGYARPDGGMDIAQPTEIIFEDTPQPITTPPALRIRPDLARALYDALGAALGIHTPDARLAAETLKREQDRVDRLIDNAIKLTGGT